MNRELSKAIINLVVMAVLTINAGLTAKGINPIPFDESAVTEVLTYIASGAAAVWAWWKNNNVTKNAQYAQESLNALKSDFVDDGERGEDK